MGDIQRLRNASTSVADMTKLVLTAIGDEREGLVSALSRTVQDHDGNWLDSQFTRLAGKFSGIVLVDIAPERAEEFGAAAAQLHDEVGLTVHVSEAEIPASASTDRELHVQIVGMDRPGMVRQITAALAELGASIRTLHSWTSDSPEGGGVLFQADVIVTLLEGTESEAVRQVLEPIADELMVDLELAESD